MQERDHRPKSHNVARDVAKEEAVCSDMMEKHLWEIASVLIEESVLDEVAKVEAPSVQRVVVKRWRVFFKDDAKRVNGYFRGCTSFWPTKTLIKLWAVFEHTPAPDGCTQEVD